MGSSRLTWGVGRSVEKSLEQLHVFDVVNINGLFEAHHEPLQDTADYRSLRSNIMEPVLASVAHISEVPLIRLVGTCHNQFHKLHAEINVSWNFAKIIEYVYF